MSEKQYHIYARGRDAIDRRVASCIPEERLERRIEDARNCYPDCYIDIVELVEVFSQEFAPKCESEGACTPDCSDRGQRLTELTQLAQEFGLYD